MWFLGAESSPAYQAELKFDRLRYRLLPYIYSLAGDVTQRSGTFMRPLVMDFPDDERAREITDEYMFGPAFLVAPVTTYKARSRFVYLPAGVWYDFWTGAIADKRIESGSAVNASALFDAIPVHVRAGSIIPFGPELQYTTEKKSDPITLFVYTGADGSFNLYEDDGLTYNYEKGQYAMIPIRWNEAKQTLTIGKRKGSFAGMLSDRVFNVVLVSKSHPVGFSLNEIPESTQHKYDGSELVLNFQTECCKK